MDSCSFFSYDATKYSYYLRFYIHTFNLVNYFRFCMGFYQYDNKHFKPFNISINLISILNRTTYKAV